MRIIFVDHDKNAHINFRHELKSHKEVASLDCFYNAQDALRFTQVNPVDCAFLNIELEEEENGLDLARSLKAVRADIEIAFFSAFVQHAHAAYQVGGRAYMIKPYDIKELDDALDIMYRLVITRRKQGDIVTNCEQTSVQIKTFGNFDLMISDCAVSFKNAKAKEALAFLVHQMGGSVNGAQIFLALWEGQEYSATNSIYVRRTIRALEEELSKFGITDLVVKGRNSYSINPSRIICDSYLLLKGNKECAHHFAGEYMRQYAWGENTIPLLERAAKRALEA